ncbi:DNA polymerase III subunit gamma and tau [Intrasporangium sp. DVR]|uniref:DNA polymerase III subunit gamma and tau n=1 Tax=Intrasporangium sp. DVR TaxID=3127867 RepID=UPI00313A6665
MATALYRRYRPESFAEVIGQEHVTEPLMQALRTGRVNHAYLFSGPRGCGKTTSARILARCLNCEQGPTPDPCGVCDSCVALARGGAGSVDVIEIDAASHGGVDDARDLRERASYGPAQSRFKIYIIDEAHMVTTQGFNALLKIVEEPPEHVKFVFATTEPEKVIGTIRSRTHHYPFRLVPPAKLTAYMESLLEQEGVAVAPGVLSFVVRAGGGSVRDSLSVLDQLIAGSGPEGLTYESAVSLLGFTDGELLDATVDALAAGDGAATFRQIDRVIESGLDPRRFIEDLLERLRDLIIVAAVPEAGQVLRGVPEDQLERMRVQQAAFGPGALSRAADIVNAGLTEMTGATAPRMQLELICARVLLPASSGEAGYGARLDRLERRLEVGGVPSAAAPSHGPAPARMPLSSPPQAPPVPAPPDPAESSVQNAPAPADSSVQNAPAPADSSVQNAPSSAPGGMDTDAIRRAWPEVLGRIFSRRRITWTFVSQHAQVMGYDGTTLTLGIATAGLTNTFRSGNHAEIVRQALIDELGVDAVVDGVHVADVGGAGHASSPGAPPEGSGPPGPRPDPEDPRGAGAPADPADSGPPPAVGGSADSRESSAPPPARPPTRPTSRPPAGGPAPAGRSLEDNAGWGSVSAPAPEWATRPSTGAATQSEREGPPPVRSATAPGASAVRESLGAARRGGLRSPGEPPAKAVALGRVTDDAAVSDDDEDIELSGDVGRAVIEKVLGGRVISEIDD